jgi:hypothetical protein
MHAEGQSLYKAEPCEAHQAGLKSTEADIGLSS